MKKIAVSVVFGALIILVITLGVIGRPISLTLPHIFFGWIDFTVRNAHQMRFRWEVLWSVLIYIALLVVGEHFFARWLYRSWKWSWTLRGFVVFLLMFIAGTSAVAVVEQSKWLANSERSLYAHNNCPQNLRQIGQWLLLYQNDHQGKYPDDLAELLVADPDFHPELLCCELAGDQPAHGNNRPELAENTRQSGHCSYLYFGKGRSFSMDDRELLACDDPAYHGGGMYALFGDGSVMWLDEGLASKTLHQARTLAATRAATQPSR